MRLTGPFSSLKCLTCIGTYTAQRVRKPRKKTRPTRASVRRRLNTKRRHGDRKRSRKPVDF